MSEKILITGASAGFGKLMTNTLLAKGHTVVASMRGVDGKNKAAAEELKAAGAHIVEIDVTDENSVNAGVEAAVKAMGGITVVVNNAGVGVLGLQETFTTEDWQKVFDVNVFGVQRVNRAVLPTMREQKNGLLIHISSLLGRFVLPFFGPYNASKYALEALADNYRVELSGFGIESCLIEPGGFGTNFMSGLIRPTDKGRDAGYGEMAGAPEGMLQNFEGNLSGENAPDPQWIADIVADLVAAPRGQRAFRTVRDGLGMEEPIKGINAASDQATTGIYTAFGMEGMLKTQV